ncbi:hypothetical protein O181_046966 [Austropuccinia psidii MF-1]|uniref:Uncharacterized protein n=1 Tax=Austropuccinia psidii MF-1 TaxID=1389203 RepID=A0A9Q3HJ42_9BASI|nr:hypothetical protein [Austropuccinia psidii MF-1]
MLKLPTQLLQIASTELQQSSSSQDLNSSHDKILYLTAQPATKPINRSDPTGSNFEKYIQDKSSTRSIQK